MDHATTEMGILIKMLNIWYLYESRIWYQRGSILILNLPCLAQGGSLLRLRNHVWRRKEDENSGTINQRFQLITLRSTEWPTVLEGVWGREENCEGKVQKSESCITSEAEGLLKKNFVSLLLLLLRSVLVKSVMCKKKKKTSESFITLVRPRPPGQCTSFVQNFQRVDMIFF